MASRSGLGPAADLCAILNEPCAQLTPGILSKRVGLEILEQHAKCSQDLNPIENIWRLLRERLYETLPKKLETRGDFEARVRSAVRWLNYHKQEEMWYLSTNPKERADDVIYLEGGRTGW